MTDERSDPAAIRGETLLVAWIALGIGLVALAYCVRHGTLLLYGDAVAHLHIARRVFDSITPGFRQLGSVWLPLPHILLLPFVWNMAWWQNGLAGACLSIPSYVLGCAGIYRLARMWLDRAAAILVVAFYGLNPGLLYMATTAMTEPLFLAEMIWAVLLIIQYERALVAPAEPTAEADEPTPEPGRLLMGAGLVLVCAIFTRYDGWVYAAALWLFATRPLIMTYRVWEHHRWRGPVAGAWVFFTAMLIAAPSLWLAYNAKQFGDPLDFLRGPYSARAIDARTTPPGSSPHPGFHNLRDRCHLFLESRGAGRRAVGPGKAVVLAQCCRHAGGIVGLSPAADLAGVAAMVAAALLCLLRGLWIGAHLHPHLAAIFLVQHALWLGTAARLRALCRLPVCGADIPAAAIPPLRDAGGLAVVCGQQCRAAAVPAVGVSGGGGQLPFPDRF